MPGGFGFNVDRMNAFLQSIGMNATWARVSKCPCLAERTGGVDVSCPVCDGLGYLWQTPTAVVLGISSMNGTRQYAMFSEWQKGDLVCTIPSNSAAYDAGEFDRIVLTQGQYLWDEVHKRGLNDRLKYTSIKEVIEVWAIVGGVKTVLVAETDYHLNGATIEWLTSTVENGQQYAVKYKAAPEYFIFHNLVQDRPQEGKPLPRRVQLRLMDLFDRKGIAA